MSVAPVRIMLADDHTLVRRGVRLILDGEPDLQVVAEADDGPRRSRRPRAPIDLAVLDVAMPRHDRAAGDARDGPAHARTCASCMLSMYDNEQYFFEALRGRGIRLRAQVGRRPRPGRGLPGGVLRGEPFIYPAALSALMRDYLQRGARGERIPDQILTPREDEVLKLIAEGHSSKEMAELLVISLKTVERHRANILAKLGMRDRTELTRYAIRAGIIEP